MSNSIIALTNQPYHASNLLVLTSEEDAWQLLESMRNETSVAPDALQFGDWCKLELWLEGEKWKGTITPSVFPVFENLQKAIHHVYAECKYGVPDTRKLTDDEKEQLEIVIKVGKGSSIPGTDIDLTAIARACITKMNGKQLATVLVLSVLIWCGKEVWNHHVDMAKEIRLAELQNSDKDSERRERLKTVQTLTDGNAKHIELVENIIRELPQLAVVREDGEELHRSMMKAAARAEKSEIGGVKLSQDQAEELTKASRPKAIATREDGIFTIEKVDWKHEPPQIYLKREQDGLAVKADFQSMLSDDDKTRIKEAEWSDEKTINVNLNVMKLPSGKITQADLIKVHPKADSETNIEAGL